MLQVVDGPFGVLVWRSNSRGQETPGIGDRAWLNANRAAARLGDTIVVITLVGQGKGHGAQLADLPRQAIARIPVGAAS
jgi:hypothetical protein